MNYDLTVKQKVVVELEDDQILGIIYHRLSKTIEKHRIIDGQMYHCGAETNYKWELCQDLDQDKNYNIELWKRVEQHQSVFENLKNIFGIKIHNKMLGV